VVNFAEYQMTAPRGATWVGLLEMDDVGPVTGVTGPLRADHEHARVLIRLHKAPVGNVSVSTKPVETLTDRVRTAAEATLADALQRHASRDNSACKPDSSSIWEARTACPRHFPPADATGMTVIVCTRDRTTKLLECLRTLQEIAYSPLEIIIVDNAPSCSATREALAAISKNDVRIVYTCEPRPGLSRARNHGMASASYDIVAFTDDDTVVDPGWLTAIAAGFAADPEAVCVTGLVAPGSLDTNSERYFDARFSWGEAFEPHRYDLSAHRHPSRLYPFKAGIFGTGANFAVRRSAVRAAGDFDPLLGAGSPSRGGEDLDIFLRLILSGGRICYVPSAIVWHRHRADADALTEQVYSYGHGLGAYVAKHLPNGDLRRALAGYGFHQVGVQLGRMHRASQVSQSRVDGRRLALTEVRGVMAGALCYRRAARHPPAAGSGAP
jgi:GT2 family glycosyltransferase